MENRISSRVRWPFSVFGVWLQTLKVWFDAVNFSFFFLFYSGKINKI